MSEITNYNCHIECADICMQEFCGELATHFFPIEIGNFKFLVAMCEEHYFESIGKEVEI